MAKKSTSKLVITSVSFDVATLEKIEQIKQRFPKDADVSRSFLLGLIVSDFDASRIIHKDGKFILSAIPALANIPKEKIVLSEEGKQLRKSLAKAIIKRRKRRSDYGKHRSPNLEVHIEGSNSSHH
jgi:hypothetical protein